MLLIEKLQEDVRKLPENLQQEVLDFVEFLLYKLDEDAARREETEWSHAALAYVMSQMDKEDGGAPTYSLHDLKEHYQ